MWGLTLIGEKLQLARRVGHDEPTVWTVDGEKALPLQLFARPAARPEGTPQTRLGRPFGDPGETVCLDEMLKCVGDEVLRAADRRWLAELTLAPAIEAMARDRDADTLSVSFGFDCEPGVRQTLVDVLADNGFRVLGLDNEILPIVLLLGEERPELLAELAGQHGGFCLVWHSLKHMYRVDVAMRRRRIRSHGGRMIEYTVRPAGCRSERFGLDTYGTPAPEPLSSLLAAPRRPIVAVGEREFVDKVRQALPDQEPLCALSPDTWALATAYHCGWCVGAGRPGNVYLWRPCYSVAVVVPQPVPAYRVPEDVGTTRMFRVTCDPDARRVTVPIRYGYGPRPGAWTELARLQVDPPPTPNKHAPVWVAIQATSVLGGRATVRRGIVDGPPVATVPLPWERVHGLTS